MTGDAEVFLALSVIVMPESWPATKLPLVVQSPAESANMFLVALTVIAFGPMLWGAFTKSPSVGSSSESTAVGSAFGDGGASLWVNRQARRAGQSSGV